MKAQTYSGKDLLQTNIFGFYWNKYDSDGYTPIKQKSSMNNILREFNRIYKPKISNSLNNIGLQLGDVKYYSPKQYNYGDDELDFNIRITNLKKFMEFLVKNKLSSKEEMNLAIQNNYYNPAIEDMSKVFEILNLTANDLEITQEFVLDNIDYDRRFKENK